MNELTRLALHLQGFCEERGWKFCVIGGIAVMHWGEPRFTMDLDMTLLTGFGGEEAFVDEWLAHFEPRLKGAREFALRNRVLLLQSENGVGIDIALGALPFEESAVQRARKIEMEPGAEVLLCTPEDLIVMKAFAYRDLDWHDIRGILIRQGKGALDWDYIYEHLIPLCEVKESPEILKRLRGLQGS